MRGDDRLRPRLDSRRLPAAGRAVRRAADRGGVPSHIFANSRQTLHVVGAQHARARLDAAARTPRQAAAPADRPEDRPPREDGRTWTTDRAWTDQDRAGIQRCTPTDPNGKDTRTNNHIRMDAWREAEARREYYRSPEYHAEQRARFLDRRTARAVAHPRTGHRREYTAREAQPRQRR